MELFESAWQVVSALIVFSVGLFLVYPLCKYFVIGNKIGFFIYIYHTFFCMVYLSFVLNYGGDALQYYRHSQNILPDFRPGTPAILYLVNVVNALDLSIVGVFLCFNIFGFIGLIAFYSALITVTKHSSRNLRYLALAMVFLPSVSFWSSGLGKDAISFMATGLALYAALNFNKRIVLMMVAVALMLFVRPHIAGTMVIAIIASIVFKKDLTLMARTLVGAIGLVTAGVMIPFALNYAGVEEDASNLGRYIEKRQGYNQKGGGGVDISSMSLPMQMFTYLVRPLPFEARSIPQLLASLDNILILYLLFVGMRTRLKVKNLQLTGNRVFMWWYVGISWVILSMTTANLGISVRQKWMFTPILIFLLISIIAAAQEKKRINKY